MALGDAVERNGEHARAGPEQIDLDQADASRPQLLLLLDVQVPPGTWSLVRRAEHLDHRHNPPARLDVDDLDEPLPDRLGLIQVDHQRLGHRDAVPRPDPSFLRPAALDDPHIRDDVPALPLGWLDEDALAHSRQQVTRQVPLERIARIGDQTVMNIAPELFEVRVHPGKRTAHGRSLRRFKGTFRNSTGDTGLEPFILWLADYGTAPAPSWARVDSRDSVLAAVPAQHFLDWIHPRCGFEELCPGLEQGFHDGGIVASPAMPAVLGTVRRPAEWRGVEVVLGIFQRGIRSEQGLDQSEIAVPGGPVQWCPAVLPTGRHR